jgi:hypothetical protein
MMNKFQEMDEEAALKELEHRFENTAESAETIVAFVVCLIIIVAFAIAFV